MKTLSTILLLFITSLLTAQNFEVPENVVLENASDYADYEDDVIQAVDWLMDTQLAEKTEKRKEVTLFFMLWITGAPDVTIEINTETADFGDCSECLMIFMGEWTKYVLKTGDNDLIKGNLTGLEGVITFYQKNEQTIGKNKYIKKLIKLQKKGKLEEHIESVL